MHLVGKLQSDVTRLSSVNESLAGELNSAQSLLASRPAQASQAPVRSAVSPQEVNETQGSNHSQGGSKKTASKQEATVVKAPTKAASAGVNPVAAAAVGAVSTLLAVFIWNMQQR